MPDASDSFFVTNIDLITHGNCQEFSAMVDGEKLRFRFSIELEIGPHSEGRFSASAVRSNDKKYSSYRRARHANVLTNRINPSDNSVNIPLLKSDISKSGNGRNARQAKRCGLALLNK